MMVAPQAVSCDLYFRYPWKEPGVAPFVFVFRRLLNRASAPLLLCAAAATVALLASAMDARQARADSPHPRWGPMVSATASSPQPAAADDPIQMAIDMDPSSPPTVESAATISVPQPFNVGINVTSVAPGTLYRG